MKDEIAPASGKDRPYNHEIGEWGKTMTKGLIGSLAVILVTLALAIEPAFAISAALAKQCREKAIKAHPPESTEGRNYVRAQQEYFRMCVEKKGNI